MVIEPREIVPGKNYGGMPPGFGAFDRVNLIGGPVFATAHAGRWVIAIGQVSAEPWRSRQSVVLRIFDEVHLRNVIGRPEFGVPEILNASGVFQMYPKCPWMGA